MARNKAERRANDRRAEKRKADIIKYVYRDRQWATKFEGQAHRLSKAKVHCSCSMCRFEGETMQDARTKERLDSSLREYMQ